MGKCKFLDLLLCYTNNQAFFTLPGLSKNSKKEEKRKLKQILSTAPPLTPKLKGME